MSTGGKGTREKSVSISTFQTAQPNILTNEFFLIYNYSISTLSFTSLEEARTEPLANTAGLVTDTGLVKAESRLEDSDVGLCSLLLAFHWLGCNAKTNHINTEIIILYCCNNGYQTLS